MTTRTVDANLDAWLANTLGGAGNGKGDRMGVGFGTDSGAGDGSWTWQNRFAVRFARGTLFDGIIAASQISAAKVKLRANNSNFGIGGTVKFWLERGTTAFTENPENRRGYVSGTGATSGHWPGPTRTTTDRVKYEGAPVNGDWIAVSMLDMIRAWYSNGWSELILVGVAADATTGYDESVTARRCTFQTRESTSAPYIEITFELNQAPDIPTDLAPAGDVAQPSTSGTQLTLTARHGDPDGDAATRDHFEVYADSATDATPGTPLASIDTAATTAHNALRTRTVTGLPARTFLKWRARFKDATLWGAFSLLQRTETAYQPGLPAQPVITPGTLSPDFFASLISSDLGDYITAAEVNVYQDPAQGQTITKWASGKVTIGGSPNRVQMAYGGTALVWGTQYRWRIRLWNRDDVATEFTGDLYFTQLEPSGPTIVPGDLNTKVNTRTPTFTLTDPGAANIDQYRMWFYSPSGVLLSDTGTVSQASALVANVTTPAGIWDWGQEPLVVAAIRLTGNADLGPASAQKRIHLNARPGSPYPLSVTHASAQVVQRADGVWVIDDDQPTVTLPFRDTDKDLGYSEAPTRQEVEVRDLADAHFASSPYVATSAIDEDFETPALDAETTYKVRARYDDNAAVRSDWSDYAYVKSSAAPTLANVTPADAATVTDPTPTIAWEYSSGGGKEQAFYRIIALVDGASVYNTGLVAGDSLEHTIPAFVLPNASTVDWTLEVWDTDGLKVSLARRFDTDFSQPDALTGVAVTADEDAKALVVSWDASTLDADEFESYYVEARTNDEQWRRVAAIATLATTSYVYRFAPHNVPVTVRVLQSNGWADSEPVEVVGELAITGTWWLRPAPIELLYLRDGDFSGSNQTRREEFRPLGASYATVLTWETTGYAWRMSLLVPEEAAPIIDILRADQRSGLVGILKLSHGKSYYSVIRSVADAVKAAGFWEVGIEGLEVDPDTADF